MNKENFFNAVYDILVNLGGANEQDRNSFVYNHTSDETTEWRFCGHLGFGGKYRSLTNKVDCYREGATPEIRELINKINKDLGSLK